MMMLAGSFPITTASVSGMRTDCSSSRERCSSFFSRWDFCKSDLQLCQKTQRSEIFNLFFSSAKRFSPALFQPDSICTVPLVTFLLSIRVTEMGFFFSKHYSNRMILVNLNKDFCQETILFWIVLYSIFIWFHLSTDLSHCDKPVQKGKYLLCRGPDRDNYSGQL